MPSGRRVVARIANIGLVVFGLALLVVLGTGGTRLDLRFVSIGLRSVAPPLTFFCIFAALRLLAGTRASGLEARCVTILARQGLPPRDAPATFGSSSRAGALLGMGLGLVAAVADLVRFVLAVPHPGPSGPQYLALGLVVLLVGPLIGTIAGSIVGLAVAAAGAAGGQRLGRYEAGRWTTAGLFAILPAVVWFAPSLGPAERTPSVFLGVAAAALAAVAVAALGVPAAVLRARRGRWGLAVVGAAFFAIALCAVALVAIGPAGLYGPAGDASSPNVLIVSISGLRADHAGAYAGDPRLTPALDGVGARGIVFEHAVSPSAALPAAAASILTGLYPASHGLRQEGDTLDGGAEGLPSLLGAHGYRTAAFVSSAALTGRATGFADLFERYDDPTSVREWMLRTSLGALAARFRPAGGPADRAAEQTVDAFREWLSGLPRGPWMAWIQLSDLLTPAPVAAVPGSLLSIDERLPGLDRPLPRLPSWAPQEWAPRPLRDWLAGYQGRVARVDEQISAVRRIVAARGEVERTMIHVVAEHAAPAGENGIWFDADTSLAGASLSVPWVVEFGSNLRVGSRIGGPCSLVDVTPTVLGLIGMPGSRHVEGEDLSRYLLPVGIAARDPHSGPVFAESLAGGEHAVRLGTWLLVRNAAGEERLYRVEDGLELEVPTPRGSDARQKQQLSDMLSRRLAQEGH